MTTGFWDKKIVGNLSEDNFNAGLMAKSRLQRVEK